MVISLASHLPQGILPEKVSHPYFCHVQTWFCPAQTCAYVRSYAGGRML